MIRLGHNVETQFNSLQHGIATIWDTIWRNTVTRVQNGVSDVVNLFRGLPGKGSLTHCWAWEPACTTSATRG